MTLVLPPRVDDADLGARLAAPSPLDVLRAMASFRVRESATPHAIFCAGVFAYDLIDAFEALPAAADDPLDYPDYTFFLAESLVVIEPATGHTTVICAAFGDDDPSRARALQNDAAARLAALVDRCRACAGSAAGVVGADLDRGRSTGVGGTVSDPVAGAADMALGVGAADMASGVGAADMAPGAGAADMAPGVGAADMASGAGAADMAPCAGAVRVDMDDAEYAAGVSALKEHIARGDVFQIVPSRTFSAPCPSPIAAYAALRDRSPSPYMFYLAAADHTLFGASPETSVRVTRGSGGAFEMEIRPIAGTRRRGRAPGGAIDPDLDNRREAELLLDEKERAEHMMLVDLARNDVARACLPGTRRVTRLLTVERFSHVMHLVSRVAGVLRPGYDALGAYAAAMNMGTLVGAPKVRAAQLLRSHERTRRGPYGGAIGYFTAEGELDTAVVIRSAVVKGGVAYVRAGAGVVHDSDPAAEADETRRKAASVLDALRAASASAGAPPRGQPSAGDGAPLGQALSGDGVSGGQAHFGDGAPPGQALSGDGESAGQALSSDGESAGQALSGGAAVPAGRSVRPAGGPVLAGERGERGCDVLFVDNFDSFTFNLVDAFERLGCRVRVVRNTAPARVVLADARAAGALVVLSPGPGAPEEAGSCLEIIAAAKGSVPVLGVCLGHQAIVKEAGGVVDRAGAVVHGKASRLSHDGLGPFRGVPDPLLVGRYHSLATTSIPSRLHVHASLAGMAMAVSDLEAGQIGFQFHPESLLTPAGQTLLGNVLALASGRRPS